MHKVFPTAQTTPRQLQLLKEIATFTARQCFSPTIAELALRLNISRSTAFEHIAELRRKGLLSASPARARSLKLTSKARKLLEHVKLRTTPDPYRLHTSIPLLGRVAAGMPIEAIENRETLSLYSNFAADGDTFALQVEGDSMIDDGIHDGDYVICKRSTLAKNGQLVIALIDEQNATLKRFYKENSLARLQPANKKYQPIYSDKCKIQAVVTGLIRKF